MTISYISGFFDADGYVTLSRKNKNNISKTAMIGFTNTKLEILKRIQKSLLEQYNLIGTISSKKAKKENHKIGYDLRYRGQVAVKLSTLLESFHSKKFWRLQFLSEYQPLIKRNGKYTQSEKINLQKFETKFWRFK